MKSIKPISIAVLGAGVAGLSFGALLTTVPGIRLRIFEKGSNPGGRIFPQEVRPSVFADLGANIIDFQHKDQEQSTRAFFSTILPNNVSNNKFKLLSQPFLIYEKELRKADYYKDRYCYQGGFGAMIGDIASAIQQQSFIYNFEAQRIEIINQKWRVIQTTGKVYQQQFDYLVLALDGPSSLKLMKASKIPNCQHLQILFQQIKYTTQISSAFQLLNSPPFSCVLFKNHALTFMSSHQQKYPHSNKKVIVIQMSEPFSFQYYDSDDSTISQKIREEIPPEMQPWIGECFSIKKWRPSLIRQKNSKDIGSFQSFSINLMAVGDVCQGSSRVTGAIETSIECFRMWVQHMELRMA